MEEYVQRISEGLAKKGHKLKVFTTNIKEDFYYNKVKDASCFHNQVQILRFSALPLRIKKYAITPFMPISLILEKADIIHAHCYMYFPFDAAVLTAKLKKIPLVVNPYIAEIGPPSVLGKVYRRTLGKLAMSAGKVVVISDYEKKLLGEWGYNNLKVEKISPGVDLDEFNKINYNIYKEYGIEDKPVILFVGRLDKMKGVDILLKAFSLVIKKISEAKLVIIGPDFGQKQKLEELAKLLKLKDNIYFLGKLSRGDLISALKNAAVFVLPSRYEAFGIVLIEAMASKTPVIASRCSAIPYVVNEGHTGLLFNLDEEEDLAQKIICLFKDEKLYSGLVETAYEEVKQKYNWEDKILQMENLYYSLMNK